MLSTRRGVVTCLILVLTLGVATTATTGSRRVSFVYNNDDIVLTTDSCHSLGYGKNCTDHAGCSACHWKLSIPRWDFCVKNTTASHLPGLFFSCTHGQPAPAPAPEPEPEPPHGASDMDDAVQKAVDLEEMPAF